MAGLLKNCFEINLYWWRWSGIWSDYPNMLYKLYATLCMITLLTYNVVLTVNLFYTPLTVEAMVREVIFYFTSVATTAKVITVVVFKKDIIKVFEVLNSKMFTSDDENGQEIVTRKYNYYALCWKCNFIISHTTFFTLILSPLIIHLMFNRNLVLPICNFNFLSDNTREKYIYELYFYLSLGIYFVMTYNINIDSFIAGLMLMAVTQYDLLKYKIAEKNQKIIIKLDKKLQEEYFLTVQMNYLMHYDQLLRWVT